MIDGRPRKAVHSLAAFLIALGLSVVLAEVTVRVLMPQARLTIEPGGFYTPDPPGRYRLSPGYRGRITNRAEYDNEIRINEAGLRGPDLGGGAPERLRILAIGDSFTFGVGVEDSETFVSVLADRLGVDGLNAGIPAFGVPDAETWFRLHGRGLEPDVVILAIFVGNDLVDASPDREEILVVDGLLVPSESPRGLKAWLFRHSQFYVAVKGLLETPPLRPLRSKLGLGEPWTLRVLREELDVYRTGAEERLMPAIEATDLALGRLVADTAESEVELVAMLIPSEVQVDPRRWAAAVQTLELDASQYDPEIPSRIFRDLLGRHSVPFVELAPALAADIENGVSVYFRRDRHWTVAGHKLAGEALAEFLRPGLGSAMGRSRQ